MGSLNTSTSQIIEAQYFYCANSFSNLIRSSNIKLEACEAYQKMSFRNRMMVAGANGIVSLTVPLKNGREQKQLITQVEIDNTQDWRTLHWRTINSCYRKAPFFDYYADAVRDLIFNEQQFLFQLNLSILRWLLKTLKASVEISFTTEFLKNYAATDAMDLRNRWLPKNYKDIPFEEQIRYSQLFEDRIGFQPNLSMIDLIFNEGPNAANLLRSNIS